MLPSTVAQPYLSSPLRGSSVSSTPVLSPFVIRHGGAASVPPVHEAGSQFVVRTTAVSPVSPRTGGSATVHHLGITDNKESPFVHLRGHLQSVRAQEPASKPASGMDTCRRLSAESSDSDKPLSKRIKLEAPDDDLSSVKFYKKLYIESHERDLAEIQATYQDHMTELFFLENGGNLMDYMIWSKRPNVHLNRLLQAESLDADVECPAGEEEKQINNEVINHCLYADSLCFVVQDVSHCRGGWSKYAVN